MGQGSRCSADVEPRHRDSIWATVRRAFDCFADPKVLEATRVDHDTFDPAAFLDENGTIYLMGSPGAQHSVAPIVAALIEDVVDTARRKAARSQRRRLESGLVLMLDECANIAPLGDLPKLVAELGGLGITTAVILQSVASARTIWGEAGERALRDLANITLVWGGQKDMAFLEEISRLAGEHDELVETVTHRAVGRVRGRHAGCRCSRPETSPTWPPITPWWCPRTSGPGLPTCHPGGRSRRLVRSGRSRAGGARIDRRPIVADAAATGRVATFGAPLRISSREVAIPPRRDRRPEVGEVCVSDPPPTWCRPTSRTLPTDGEPVDLGVLAKWVNSLQVRYAAEPTGSSRAGGVTGSSWRSWLRSRGMARRLRRQRTSIE